MGIILHICCVIYVKKRSGGGVWYSMGWRYVLDIFFCLTYSHEHNVLVPRNLGKESKYYT